MLGQLLERIGVVTPYKNGSYEGVMTFKRDVEVYGISLRFDPHLLAKQRVLDFGCGRSDIGQDLRKLRITPKVVHLVDGNFEAKMTNPKVELLDGRELDKKFPRESVDIALARFSTYQVPFIDRRKVFINLLRAARRSVHIGPIFGEDFDYLIDLVGRSNRLVVTACRPFVGSRVSEIFDPKTLGDYASFRNQYTEAIRVIRPDQERPRVISYVVGRILDYSGGSYIAISKR